MFAGSKMIGISLVRMIFRMRNTMISYFGDCDQYLVHALCFKSNFGKKVFSHIFVGILDIPSFQKIAIFVFKKRFEVLSDLLLCFSSGWDISGSELIFVL